MIIINEVIKQVRNLSLTLFALKRLPPIIMPLL